MPDHGAEAGPVHRTVEIGVGVLILVFSLIVIAGALQAGVGWGAEGPKAGFFPFIIGIAIVISSGVNIALAYAQRADKLFAQWSQLRQVVSVIAPTALYVGIIPYIGIYVASWLLIAGFMKWFGRYGWPLAISVALLVPVLIFLTFERWFLVPLPKGPIEEYLGF